MKKLLSLLSVLTISGSAVPITIAASPYQKLKNINNNNFLQENNFENLNRIKKDTNKWQKNRNKNLNVPEIRQLNNHWCGPAIGESLLRYFGINLNLSSLEFQTMLAERMHTIPQRHDINVANGGTIVGNWTNTINEIISQNNTNIQYTMTSINNNISNIDNIDNIIYNSLQSNVPVALAYTGNLPEYFSDESQDSYHFILIRGITGRQTSNINNPRYRIQYMDPWTGQYGEFETELFRLLMSNWQNHNSYLVHYVPTIIETQIPNPNQTNPNGIGNYNSNFLMQNSEHFCEFAINLDNNKNRLRRQVNYDQCPIINKDNPFFQENDVFEVDYKFLSHDKIKLKISLKTALGIEKMFFENNQHKFKEYLKELFKKMPKNDNTGAGGSISDNDYDVMKNFVFNNYSYFHNAIKNLQNNKTYSFILIDINRGTEGLEPEAITLK